MAQPAGDGDLGSLLCVFAHPDDEAYLAGALMAAAGDAGRRVVCVTATRGELGFPEGDRRSIDERKDVRSAELAACLDILGVREHHWLEYPDSGCVNVPDVDAALRLTELIDDVRPDTVLTFGPDGQTYHDDHISVSRWTTLACDAASSTPRLLYAAMTPAWVAAFAAHVPFDEVMMVPGAEPPTVDPADLALWYLAEGDVLERKVQALVCQESQTGALLAQLGTEVFAGLVADELYRLPRLGDWPE